MIMEVICPGLAGAGIFAGMVSVRHEIKLKRQMEELTEEISHFLLYPEKTGEESLGEGEIHNLTNQIIHMENQLLHEKQFQNKREEQVTHFVENMAHQMKTAVTALQIRLDLAHMKTVTAEEKEALVKSQECMERLCNEIDRILKSSQLAAGKVLMDFEKIDLEEIVSDCIAHVNAIAAKKQVNIEMEGKITVSMKGDLFWLSQAIENILKNAVEHTKENGKVFVSLAEKGRNVEIKIEDEGKGIQTEELAELFKRFSRGSVTKAGYGIGLSMANDIVAAHHGTLAVGNRDEGGAWFMVRLPVLEGSKAYG